MLVRADRSASSVVAKVDEWWQYLQSLEVEQEKAARSSTFLLICDHLLLALPSTELVVCMAKLVEATMTTMQEETSALERRRHEVKVNKLLLMMVNLFVRW